MAEATIDLPVLGMTCAACVRRVERAACAVPGIASAEVNLPLSRALLVGLDIERARVDETAGLRRDAIIAVVATALLFVIAMAHGMFEGAASVIAQLALGT